MKEPEACPQWQSSVLENLGSMVAIVSYEHADEWTENAREWSKYTERSKNSKSWSDRETEAVPLF